MSSIPKAAIFSLYRSYRRQINLLPSEYLRQFFRIKVADDVRSILSVSSHDDELQRTKFKRVRKDYRKLVAAHTGDHQAYAHVLDVAYGRKGKLKWEIMEARTPLLSDPTAPIPDPIIPAVEKSRPPVYSPELSALLTSGLSRDKPLSAAALKNPPLLPERADHKSEEARLLGPLSLRREVNIRWRFFKSEWRKVYPPLQVAVTEATASTPKDAELELRTDKDTLANAEIRGFGLQGTGAMEDLISAAGSAVSFRPRTRRERAPQAGADTNDANVRPLLPRFIRRRFRQLLARTPVLTYTRRGKSTHEGKRGDYGVVVAPNALSDATRRYGTRIPEPHDSYLAWVGQPLSKRG
ncbi:hypothetical protein NM688_g3001 [Phlebia brevispora]|uniref:Uncharacterized protein n=1 Tax=Phlebia brevispora TaxID=194682 RepID=A0ACC1T6W6_9APHY|nr:hypothetical protein NM688_g3001 [Phlebia brevispora]